MPFLCIGAARRFAFLIDAVLNFSGIFVGIEVEKIVYEESLRLIRRAFLG
jgi:hypothetical protein